MGRKYGPAAPVFRLPDESDYQNAAGTPKGVVNGQEVKALLEAYRLESMEFRSRQALEVSLSEYDGLLQGEEETDVL